MIDFKLVAIARHYSKNRKPPLQIIRLNLGGFEFTGKKFAVAILCFDLPCSANLGFLLLILNLSL